MQMLVQPTVRELPGRAASWERASVTEGMARVDAMMEAACNGGRNDLLGGIARRHLGSGGKRVRARLALASVAALGGDAHEAVPWAAACELLHNATLVHDDLQDGDAVRRGQPAVWVEYGPAQAVNAGDLLLMLPFLVLDQLEVPGKLRWRLTRTLAGHAAAAARGQAQELGLLSAQEIGWDAYLDAVSGKTSALFRLPVEGASLLAGFRVPEAQRIATVFGKVGVLFQLQDDVVDLYGEKGRGAPASDLREGKVSALVVEHLARHPEDREWLLGVLRAPRAATPDVDVERVCERFRVGGALAGVCRRIEEQASDLASSVVLATFPELRTLALELVDTILGPARAIARAYA